MLEPAPRVDAVRPGTPTALADIVASLLEKEPEQRPEDGDVAAARLTALGPIGEVDPARVEERVPALTGRERKVVAVVLARKVTDPAPTHSSTDMLVETVEQRRDVLPALEDAVEPFGAHVTLLADGSAVVALLSKGAATDQVGRAARCAIALRQVCDSPIALAIGRTDANAAEGLGPVIDRAAHLFRSDEHRSLEPTRAIRLDDSTAALLEARFEVVEDRWGFLLGKERAVRGAVRTLLGKQTPFVGRTRELGTLEAVYDECVSEPIPRVVLVTGPGGVGKSRLRYELIRNLEAIESPPQVWISRGDPISAGSPLGMLAPLVRRAAGILEGEPLEVRREKLRARVRVTSAAAEECARVARVPGRDHRRSLRGRRRASAQRSPRRDPHGRPDAPGLGGLGRGRVREAPSGPRARGPALGRSRRP